MANGRFVGLIVVKLDGTDSFTAESLASQLWDCVQLLEQSGVANAVAMLHTGKRAAIVACAPGGDRKLQMTNVAATALHCSTCAWRGRSRSARQWWISARLL